MKKLAFVIFALFLVACQPQVIEVVITPTPAPPAPRYVVDTEVIKNEDWTCIVVYFAEKDDRETHCHYLR